MIVRCAPRYTFDEIQQLQADTAPVEVTPLVENKPKLTISDMTPILESVFGSRLTVRKIQDAVADYYGIAREHMRSRVRHRSVAYPRQTAMYLARTMTPMSLPDIGRRFDRDHTTVLHALRAVEERMETHPSYAIEVELLREKLAA